MGASRSAERVPRAAEYAPTYSDEQTWHRYIGAGVTQRAPYLRQEITIHAGAQGLALEDVQLFHFDEDKCARSGNGCRIAGGERKTFILASSIRSHTARLRTGTLSLA